MQSTALSMREMFRALADDCDQLGFIVELDRLLQAG